jgi:hypothetical protein
MLAHGLVHITPLELAAFGAAFLLAVVLYCRSYT